jgi:nucleotide-binding universal stress UspA family protein
MYQRILVATDGSTLSKKAVKAGLGLAEACGAEVVAFNAVPRYPVSYFEGGIALPDEQIARAERQWADQGRAVVNAVWEEARERGLKARAVVATSDLVAESILAAARKHKCDLIVMASHGRKGLKRMLLGSETQHVLTHGGLPVLVLR